MTSNEPLYTILFERLTTNEWLKIRNWAAESLTGQMVVTRDGRSIDVHMCSKAFHPTNPFGDKNPLSLLEYNMDMIIGFTDQSDYLAFIILFENHQDVDDWAF